MIFRHGGTAWLLTGSGLWSIFSKNVCAYKSAIDRFWGGLWLGRMPLPFAAPCGEAVPASSDGPGGRVMSITFLLFWVFGGLFLVDMVLGKIAILTNGAIHEFAGDVPHFLLLALSAAFLTAECLRRETRRNAARAGAAPAPPDVTIEENPTN
jgi:hypothetical protein